MPFPGRPAAIKLEGWRLLAIFAGTILALVLRPLPGGAAVLLGVTAIIATGTLPLGKALSGYSDANAWLVLAAFFIGRGLIKAGLARRIALYFVRRMGQSSLGLAYSVVASDVVLACVIPSNAARSGGVILPIARSLAEIYNSHPGATSGLLGTFLMLALHQGDTVACDMFFTGQVSNPIGAEFAIKMAHLPIDWPRWLWVALLPGLVSLVVVPWVLFRLSKPGIVRTPASSAVAPNLPDGLRRKSKGSSKPLARLNGWRALEISLSCSPNNRLGASLLHWMEAPYGRTHFAHSTTHKGCKDFGSVVL